MPGASVLEVARRHRVCTSLVYRWRRTLLRDGVASEALPLPGPAFIPRAGAQDRAGGVCLIGPPGGVRVYLAAGVTDMRKGFDGLAALVQQRLRQGSRSICRTRRRPAPRWPRPGRRTA